MTWRSWAPPIAIVALASQLILWDLGDGVLWQDEAQTALVSRTVLTHGVPMGHDGRNHFSQELGAEYGESGVWRWHTWLPFYLLAVFFGLLGESTAVARLPFALAGIGAVAATYGLGRALWPDRRDGLWAAAALATSVPFLILVRQCRWYSLAALFSALVLWGYWALAQRRRGGGAVFAAAAVLLFHTHYLYAAAALAAAFAHALYWHRDRLRPLLAWTGVALVFCAPWIVWLAGGMEYGRVYGDSAFALAPSWDRGVTFAAKLGRHVLPPALWIAAAVTAALAWRSGGRDRLLDPSIARPLSLLLLALAVPLTALALASPGPFFRYLAPLLPVVALLVGRILASVHPAVAAALLAFVVARSPFVDYLGELAGDFRGPVEGIVEYLNAHGDPDDLVAISYGDLPLKFYTPMRVMGGLTGEDLAPAADADWIILRRFVVARERDGRVRDQLEAFVDPARYRRVELPIPETRFENREEPRLHRFRSAREGEPVVLFERIREAP